MKKLISYFSIFTFCLYLLGCQTSSNQNKDETINQEDIKEEEQISDESEGNNVTQKDIFEFKHIDKAPEATEDHSIDEVIKVFFDEWSIDVPYEAVAIDIQNNEIYVDPIISGRGLRAQGGIVEVSEVNQVRGILGKYKVQEWKTDYTFEDPDTYVDGYSWKLWLQFDDGTVEKHSGEGTEVEKLTPENFREFAKELRGFVEEKLKEIEG
ncbi:hypothetical protein [Pseudogracilibacillus auburnensis]|uniref:hypothetical protein n=1 Tax=Pseudogracilibacillus auburnensis TaxID=1494959 RepID=UPI001A963C3E|nr:hypothetical protein [Pseudogracilibacillus auburnensis]MBO1001793.1 hypothetical protein [Pseudogracilibacillus auburnensis]